jgi:MFS family permease
MRDRRSIYVAVFARSLATGMMGVLLGIYLAKLELDSNAIGVIVAVGLTGAAAATLFATLYADRLGHRATLIALTLLSVAGALLIGWSTHPVALGIAAFFGMVNGMGRDRGAALVIEQAALPATVTDQERTLAFAKYNVLQDVGHAVGALFAAAPSLIQEWTRLDQPDAFRASMIVYAVLCAVPAFAYLRLSSAIETPRVTRTTRLTPASRRIVLKLSSLFALDSVAGGFLTTALLSYFFYERFGVQVETIGALFFVARLANAVSHLGAAWLAKRIGLINTMVFTHIPSSLLLMTVPFMPTFPIAAALFVLRESLVEMDVPTRQSYVMAVVQPQERTIASGITHLVRLGGWAIAPAFAGLLMTGSSLAAPIFVGAGMKILYDVALWRAFRGVRPPEER